MLYISFIELMSHVTAKDYEARCLDDYCAVLLVGLSTLYRRHECSVRVRSLLNTMHSSVPRDIEYSGDM